MNCTESNTVASMDPPPTYFFDLENCKQLPSDLFLRYMEVCQVLSYDRLGEDFTGSSAQLRALMYKITVYDIFVVTEALARDPSILQECTFRAGTYPKSYADWCATLEAETLPSSARRISLDSTGEPAAKVKKTAPTAGAAPAATAAREKTQPALDQGKEKAAAGAELKSTKTKTKQEQPKKLKPKQNVAANRQEETPPVEPRPMSPVTCGFRKTYGELSAKQVKRLEFYRKIPSLRDEIVASVVTDTREGRRFKTPSLRKLGSGIEPPDWRRCYETLSRVFRPTRVVLVKEVKPHQFDIVSCTGWRTLPSVVVTTDPVVWREVPASERINYTSGNWYDEVEMGA